VKDVAERHGGRVWAESGAEKGTVFYVAISKNLQENRSMQRMISGPKSQFFED
jgi:signal transduction histidine kinase